MARETNREKLLERYDPQQQALFDDAGIAAQLPVLEAIRRKTYEHRGVRLTEDDTKAQRLVELLSLRWGVKKIAVEMGISPHTVRAARRELARQGKLDTFEKRVAEAMEDAIEAGVYHYRDAVEAGLIAPGQIPVGSAIMTDKRRDLVGAGGQAGADTVSMPADLSEAAINASLRDVTPSKESASLLDASKPQQIEGAGDLGAPLGARLDGPATQPDPPREGGGGDANDEGGRAPDPKG